MTIAAGKCTAGAETCNCKSAADCLDQEDGNLCSGTLFCNKSLNPPACQLNPATAVVCPNAFDTACAKNACAPATGACGMAPTEQTESLCKDANCQYKLLPLGQSVPAVGCNDGNACTAGDMCGAGKCQAGTDTCVCKADADCKGQDDGNLCNGAWFNGRCWHAHANASSWQAARTACEDQGRHLASIHSLAENQFVANLLGPTKNTVLIGLHTPSGEVTQYQWTDGTPLDFVVWGYNGLPSKPGPAYMQASGGCVWLTAAAATFGGAYV